MVNALKELTNVKELINQVLLFTPKIVMSLLILFLFWLASVILEGVIHRLFEKKGLDGDILVLMKQMAKTTLLVFGILTALGTVGINISALIAGLGLTGFALGFALKDILSNFVAGILILTYHPYRRSDYISVSGLEGIVVEIDLRYTTLESEGKRILIPNSTLFTNAITVLDTKR
jgi:small-conductance mechanosensitive channel